jgi:hypothetical protein
MEKDFVKKISVWEKVSDFLMDISKYVLTAVIITSAFEELSGAGCLMCLVGIGGAILLLAVSIYIIRIAMLIFMSTKKGREWMRKFD